MPAWPARTVPPRTQVRDPLRDLPGSLVRHEGGGHAYTVRAFRACSIPHGVLEWCFQLCKRNMRELYESVWGWKDDSKRKQLEAVRPLPHGPRPARVRQSAPVGTRGGGGHYLGAKQGR